MKKFFALMLVLAMACAMLPAAAEEDMTGVWYMKTMTVGEQTIDVAMMGMEGSLTLNADGTGVMASSGQESECTWTATSITINGDTAELALADGALVITSEGTSMTFSREAPSAVEMAPENLNAAAEDFNGNWVCAYLEMEGTIVPASLMEAAGQALPVITFDNGKFTLEGGTLGDVLGAILPELTYAEGVYTGETSFGDTVIPFRLSLLEDGMLRFSCTMGETPTTMYFKTAEAEAPAA